MAVFDCSKKTYHSTRWRYMLVTNKQQDTLP